MNKMCHQVFVFQNVFLGIAVDSLHKKLRQVNSVQVSDSRNMQLSVYAWI